MNQFCWTVYTVNVNFHCYQYFYFKKAPYTFKCVRCLMIQIILTVLKRSK